MIMSEYVLFSFSIIDNISIVLIQESLRIIIKL